MHNSLKGALWSGLVFPGLGEIVLKHYYRGTAIMLTVSACMVLVIMKIIQQVSELLEEILSTGVAFNTDDLAKAVIELLPESGSPSYRILMLIIAGCWLASVFQAFLLGRRLDISEKTVLPDLTDSIELETPDN